MHGPNAIRQVGRWCGLDLSDNHFNARAERDLTVAIVVGADRLLAGLGAGFAL